jgi:hypothetical protein
VIINQCTATSSLQARGSRRDEKRVGVAVRVGKATAFPVSTRKDVEDVDDVRGEWYGGGTFRLVIFTF